MDIKAYVRGLDREEEELRIQIMRMQVRIQQLNDMRVLMMHRAEEHAAAANQPSPFGMLNGAEIAVRDPGLMLAASGAGQLSHAVLGVQPPDEAKPRKPRSNKAGRANLASRDDAGRAPVQREGVKIEAGMLIPGGTTSEKALAALTGAGRPLAPGEIFTAVLGAGSHSKLERDRISAALHSLKKRGMITRDNDGRYQPQETA